MKPFLVHIFEHATWSIGNGQSVFFWKDKWLDKVIVDDWRIPDHVSKQLTMKVADYIVEGSWNIPPYFATKDSQLSDKIKKLTLPLEDTPDKLNRTYAIVGDLTNKLSYAFLAGSGQKNNWHKIIWNSFIPPSRAFIVWRLLHNKIPNDDNLRTRGCTIVYICCFCRHAYESSTHLFF